MFVTNALLVLLNIYYEQGTLENPNNESCQSILRTQQGNEN